MKIRFVCVIYLERIDLFFGLYSASECKILKLSQDMFANILLSLTLFYHVHVQCLRSVDFSPVLVCVQATNQGWIPVGENKKIRKIFAM